MGEIADPQDLVVPVPNEALWKTFGMIERFPKNITFATQNEDEVVFVMIRKHLIRNFGWFINLIILGLLPFVIMWLVNTLPFLAEIRDFLKVFFAGYASSSILTALTLIYHSSLITYGFIRYLDWFFDIDLITNQRMICVDFKVLQGRSITESPLKDIIDLGEKKYGVFPAVFNYGEVSFRSSAENEVYMTDVPAPTWVRDVLADLVKYFREQRYDQPADGADSVSAGNAKNADNTSETISEKEQIISKAGHTLRIQDEVEMPAQAEVPAESVDIKSVEKPVKLAKPKKNISNIEP